MDGNLPIQNGRDNWLDLSSAEIRLCTLLLPPFQLFFDGIKSALGPFFQNTDPRSWRHLLTFLHYISLSLSLSLFFPLSSPQHFYTYFSTPTPSFYFNWFFFGFIGGRGGGVLVFPSGPHLLVGRLGWAVE